MNWNDRMSVASRIIIFVALYVAAIVFLFGSSGVAARPLVLLWPLTALVDGLQFLFSVAHWSSQAVTNGVGALLLIYFWVTLLRFLLGRVGLIPLLAIALGLIFVYSAVPKILEVHDFARDIRNYRFMPSWSYNLAALWLPWIELLSGFAVVSGVWKKGGNIVILGLLIVFTLAVISAVIRGLDIDCGCFGHTADQIARAHRVGLQKIIENLAMTAVAVFLTFAPALRKGERAGDSSLSSRT